LKKSTQSVAVVEVRDHEMVSAGISSDGIHKVIASPQTVVSDAAIVVSTKEPKRMADVKYIHDSDSNSKKRKMNIADSEEIAGESAHPKSGLELVQADITLGKQKNHLQLPQRILAVDEVRLSPNTAYIFCPEAQQVSVQRTSDNEKTSSSSNAFPDHIALLIPSSVLNSSSDSRIDSSLLEVSCQVMNMHLWPVQNITSR